MKTFLYRLLPAVSLVCLPLFGGYHPASPREGLHLDGARLSAMHGKMARVAADVTRDYYFSIVATAPRDGLRDFGPLVDYRFFSTLSNFRDTPAKRVTASAILARTNVGQDLLGTINIGASYSPSHSYPGYGRFWFNAGKTRIHDFYGRQNAFTPWADQTYLEWVSRDLLVRATGSPYEWLPASPAGW
jgi:hypothetical protein